METSSDQEKLLRLAIWAIVSRITQEESIKLGKPVSPDFIVSLANVVFKQIQTFGLDVEAFASHCRRTVINNDDVLLCARRNESLHELLSSALQDIVKKRPKNKHPQQ